MGFFEDMGKNQTVKFFADPTGVRGRKDVTPKSTFQTAANPLGEGTRKILDPGDIGLADAIYGDDDIPPDMSDIDAAQAAALAAYRQSVEDYAANGYKDYEWQGDLDYQALGDLEQQGASAYNDIKTDPRYDEFTQDALLQLQDQAENGFTDSDRADMMRVEQAASRANRGRQGAIRQDMQARGMSGSGLEMVNRQQAAQDAADREAYSALEKNGQMLDRKSAATMNLGNMSGNLQARDFGQQAQIAGANDSIARFNADNINRQRLINHEGINGVNRYNHSGRQETANHQTQGKNNFAGNVQGARAAAAGMDYNYVADQGNRQMGAWAAKQASDSAQENKILQVGGTVVGAFASDKRVKENVANESDSNIEAFLDNLSQKSYNYKGENQPKHGVIAQDLEKSKIGSDMVQDIGGVKHVKIDDAVSGLLQAVAYLNKKVKG